MEVVITGVDLGSYGDENERLPDLGGLLQRILDSTHVHRIRISSLEPGDFKPGWLSLWPNPRLCRHLHMPLQAGSDSVLMRMRRKYGTAQFLEMLEECQYKIPGLTVTTDVMVGFPGETDEEFEEGRSFIERCRFDGLHVFQYSVRPGTAAAKLPDQVPEDVKKDRSAILRHLAEEGKRSKVRRSIGTWAEVIWENERDGIWRGLTDTNVRVFSSDSHIRTNLVETRTITAAYRDGCWGEMENHRIDIPLIAV